MIWIQKTEKLDPHLDLQNLENKMIDVDSEKLNLDLVLDLDLDLEKLNLDQDSEN